MPGLPATPPLGPESVSLVGTDAPQPTSERIPREKNVLSSKDRSRPGLEVAVRNSEPTENAYRDRLRSLMDDPRLRRVFLVTDQLGGAAESRVASLVERSTRRDYFKITISQGIVIDPAHPDRAVVFAVVLDETELTPLRKSLQDQFKDHVQDREIDPAVAMQLADIGQFVSLPAHPDARVTIPRQNIAFLTDGPTLAQERSARFPISPNPSRRKLRSPSRLNPLLWSQLLRGTLLPPVPTWKPAWRRSLHRHDSALPAPRKESRRTWRFLRRRSVPTTIISSSSSGLPGRIRALDILVDCGFIWTPIKTPDCPVTTKPMADNQADVGIPGTPVTAFARAVEMRGSPQVKTPGHRSREPAIAGPTRTLLRFLGKTHPCRCGKPGCSASDRGDGQRHDPGRTTVEALWFGKGH